MIKELRVNKGITLSFLAERLNTTRTRLTRIESGKVDLPTKFIPVMAELYGVTIQELVKIHIKEISNEE